LKANYFSEYILKKLGPKWANENGLRRLVNYIDHHDQTPNSNSLIFLGDSAEVLNEIDDASVQLVLTSPPYNLRKEYERDKRMTLKEYLCWLEPIVEKLVSKVYEQLIICWQFGIFIKKGKVYQLYIFFYYIFKKQNI